MTATHSEHDQQRFTLVKDVMTSGVVAAHEQATFKEIVQSLARNRVGSVPVIDDDRKVVGVVSESDLLTHLVIGRPSPVTASHRIGSGRDRRRKEVAENAADLMTSPAVTISADATVAEAARLTAKARVHRLPVVDSSGELLGIVSRGDLLKFYLRDDESVRTQIIDEIIVSRMAIDPLAVTVTVEQGIVALSGRLGRRLLVQELFDEVRALDGVVAVHSTVGYDVDDTVQHVPYPPFY